MSKGEKFYKQQQQKKKNGKKEKEEESKSMKRARVRKRDVYVEILSKVVRVSLNTKMTF